MKSFAVRCRIDTPEEMQYYKHGGILPYVLRELISKGAIVRVCGSQTMARGVAQALDAILATMGLSVQQLKAHGRYAEDTF